VFCAGERSITLIDVAAGQSLWQREHDLPGGVVFRPRVADGIAICAGEEALGAWQVGSGKPLWRYRAREQLGVPSLHDGQVFVGDGHELVCLNLATGKERWRFAAIADNLISYAPTATGDMVFVGPGDGRLYALAVTDGSLRWQVNHIDEWQYLRQLHVAGKVLVAGSYKEILYGIDILRGEILWRFNAGNFINSHHVAAGRAYLWSPTGWLYAIDARTGNIHWRHLTTDYSTGRNHWASLLAELVVLEDRLYALDIDNVLHVLKTTDNHELMRLKLPEAVQPFLLPLSPNRLLFGTKTGDLLQVLPDLTDNTTFATFTHPNRENKP